MERLDFTPFSNAVDAQFKKLTEQANAVLVRVDISGDDLYEKYLDAYPTEHNGIFRERREYDGNYDKNYIRRLGNVVSVTADGTVNTIWNVKVPSYFQDVADALHALVSSLPLKEVFLTTEPTAGSKPNKDNTSDIIWTHFYSRVPSQFVIDKYNIGTKQGEITATIDVFARGLEAFTLDAAQTVLELINTNALYRGAEFKTAVQSFVTYKTAFDKITDPKAKRAFILYNAIKKGPQVRFRSSVIGTLVEDISLGVDLEKAVASFEAKVAPSNYKRTSAVVTPRMVEDAKKTINELGLMDSLSRRFATPTDINVNNVLFTSQIDKPLTVLDELTSDASRQAPKAINRTDPISINDFIEKVLPTAQKVEALVENSHTSKLMTLLTAQYATAPDLFKWNNPFSWSYNGNITDAIQERVKRAGGSVDGVLRVSLAWYNKDDLDIYIDEPTKNTIMYCDRNGDTGGVLDVDANSPSSRHIDDPVENVVWADDRRLVKGRYLVRVNQYQTRSRDNVGFELQVAFGGNIHNFHYKKAVSGTVTAFAIDYDGNNFTITNVNPDLESSTASREVWGVKTNEFVPVTSIMLSPNYWDGQAIGNKHTFFILENCATDEQTRGFYNEFLKPDLEKHRKVFELLGSKTSVTPDLNNPVDQVAGLGFSETVRSKLTVRVTGKTIRTYEVQF